MEALGWRLFAHRLFQQQLEGLTSRVERLAKQEPARFPSHPSVKMLATIRRLILEVIPRDPGAPEFRLGSTLGPDNRHWFRAKFHQRYRLFFRFSTQHRIIIYAWVNDETSLRKAGSKSDTYAQFKLMLERGELPASFDDLMRVCKPTGRGSQP